MIKPIMKDVNSVYSDSVKSQDFPLPIDPITYFNKTAISNETEFRTWLRIIVSVVRMTEYLFYSIFDNFIIFMT